MQSRLKNKVKVTQPTVMWQKYRNEMELNIDDRWITVYSHKFDGAPLGIIN